MVTSVKDEVTIYLFLDTSSESRHALEEALKAAEIAEKEYNMSVRIIPIYADEIIEGLPRIHVESLVVATGRYATVDEILGKILDAISSKDFSETIMALPAVASTYNVLDK